MDMNPRTLLSRQPTRLPWTKERLLHEQAVALGSDIDISSASAYSSTLKSYLTFCHTHTLPTDPTPNTLSFYVVYMSHHIKPTSVESYLSGICNQLELFYPDVRRNHHSSLMTCTLHGSKSCAPSPPPGSDHLAVLRLGRCTPSTLRARTITSCSLLSLQWVSTACCALVSWSGQTTSLYKTTVRSSNDQR